MDVNLFWVIWGFQGGADTSQLLLGYDAVQCCGRIQMFRMIILRAKCTLHFTLKMEATLSSETMASYHDYTASQLRRLRPDVVLMLHLEVIHKSAARCNNGSCSRYQTPTESAVTSRTATFPFTSSAFSSCFTFITVLHYWWSHVVTCYSSHLFTQTFFLIKHIHKS